MKIGSKLILGYLLVVSLMSLTAYSALQSYRNIDGSFANLMQAPVPMIKALENLQTDGIHIISTTNEIVFMLSQLETKEAGEKDTASEEEEEDSLEEEWRELASTRAQFEDSLKRYEDLLSASNSSESIFLQEIRKTGSRLIETSLQMIAMKKRGIAGSLMLEKKEELEQAERAYLQTLDKALAHQYAGMEAARGEVQETITASTRLTLFITFLSFALAIVFGLYISRQIANRLSKLKEASERIGSGQLETHLEFTERDEIGDLARAFNKMAGDLKSSRYELSTAKYFTDKVLDSMVDFVVVTDMDLKITRVNKAALELSGYEEREIIGKSGNIFSHDQPFTQKNIDLLRKKGHISNLDRLSLNKDGSFTPTSASFSILKNEQNEELGIICVGKDTSERRRQEMERRATDEIVQSVINTSQLDELFKIAHHSISKIISAENCFIVLRNPATDLMQFEYWVDQFDAVPPPSPVNKGFTGYIMRTGKSLRLTDELKKQMYEKNEAEENGTSSASWMGVPLRIGSRVIGVLAVQHYEKDNAYSERDLSLLSLVGYQLALAIERKQQEIKLKTSEMQLNEAQRLAKIGSWEWNALTGKATWSDEMYRIFGFEPQEFEPTIKEFFNSLPPRDRKLLRQITLKTYNNKLVSSLEHQITRPDGTTLTLQSKGKAVTDKNGQVTKLVGTCQDITERKEAEKALRTSEEQHRLLFESNPQPAFVFDLATLGFLAVNTAAIEKYGYSREEFLNTLTLKQLCRAEDEPLLLEALSNPNPAASSSSVTEPMLFTARHQKRDGTMLDVEITSHRLTFDGRRAEIVLVNDVTERKKIEEKLRASEQSYRAFIEQSTEGIWRFEFDEPLSTETSVEQQIDYAINHAFLAECNNAMAQMYGVESAENLLNMRLKDFLVVSDESNSEYFAQFVKNNYRITDAETHEKDSSGEEKYFLNNMVGIFENGKIVSAWGTQRDVTERRRAEEKLRIFNERLQQSNRELQDFAYVASHDLQEPLRKVQAFADRLKSKYAEKLDDTGLDYLERMRNAAGRMQTLIQDLLSFSRVTTKAQPFVPVDLEKITREVLSDLEVKIEETKAVIETESLPVLDADPSQMRQLLQNLIGNALKFHRPDAAPAIKISADANGNGANGGSCRIIVKDNGIGFDEKYLDKIFTVFQRLHGRMEYEGSGVGLAVCRKIVERHHGTITAQSSPGEGASFIINLPFTQSKTETNK